MLVRENYHTHTSILNKMVLMGILLQPIMVSTGVDIDSLTESNVDDNFS